MSELAPRTYTESIDSREDAPTLAELMEHTDTGLAKRALTRYFFY